MLQNEVNTARLDLSEINVIDYERRIKKFAHPLNQGKVSILQLRQAFAGTGIFDQLGNPKSVVHKLIVSPFFCNLEM